MDSDIEEFNFHYVNVFIPNIVWSLICLVIGIVGNVIIILVYIFKMKNYSEERYFIPILALFDLCAIIFTTIYSILDYVYFVNFQSSIICKLITFSTYSWTAISGHTLLVIGVQRYLKICKPLRPQMTLFWRRAAVAITIGYSFAFSSPLLYFAGIKEFDWTFEDRNVTVKTCALNADNNIQFNTAYFLLLSVILIIVNILAIMGVYIPIGHVIYKVFAKKRYVKNNTNHNSDVMVESRTESTDDIQAIELSSDDGFKMSCGNLENSNTDKTVQSSTHHTVNVSDRSEIRNKYSLSKQKKPHISVDRKSRSKVNFNLMLITVILFYMLSYTPVIYVLFLKTDETYYWHNLSNVQVRLQLCLLRFYVINNIVNPFIYGYFEKKIRESMKSLFKCCKP